MEDLRLVIFVLGTVGILAVLVHGFLSIRKQQGNTIRAKPRTPYNLTPERRDSDGFDADGIGEVRVKRRAEQDPIDVATRSGAKQEPAKQGFGHKLFGQKDSAKAAQAKVPGTRSQPEHKEPVMASAAVSNAGRDLGRDESDAFELGDYQDQQEHAAKVKRVRQEPVVGRAQGAPNQVQLGLLDELPEDADYADGYDEAAYDADPYYTQPAQPQAQPAYQPQAQTQAHAQTQPQQYQQPQQPQQYQQQQPQYQAQQPQRMPEPQPRAVAQEVKEEPLPDPRDVLVLHVVAREGRVLAGAEMLPCLLELNFKFGDMDIFHRHEDNAGTGKVLFSLANMVKPGVFDPDAMEQFNTHGVVLFMTLPCHGDAMMNFSTMLNSAYQLADDLNALVLDGQRQLWSEATQAQYLARIRQNA